MGEPLMDGAAYRFEQALDAESDFEDYYDRNDDAGRYDPDDDLPVDDDMVHDPYDPECNCDSCHDDKIAADVAKHEIALSQRDDLP